MSSETRSEGRASRRFGRRLLGTLLALTLLVGVLTAASLLQGARLTAASIDTLRVTQLAGSTLALNLNQPITDVRSAKLHITPATPATVTASGNTVTVAFTYPLRNGQKYTVALDNVIGRFQSTPARIAYAFRTPDARFLSLVRRSSVGRADGVLSRSLANPRDAHEVLTAQRIQEFALVSDTVFALTLSADGRTNELISSRLRGGPPTSIPLPETGEADQLHASPSSPLVGFRFSSPAVEGVRKYESTLFVVDDTSGSPKKPAPVLGIDGSPIKVSSWLFVPGTASLVVQDYDQALFVVDTTGASPISPLGRHTEIRGFLPGSTRLIVADPSGGSTIDLRNGSTTPLVLPATPFTDADVYPGKLTVIDAGKGYLQAYNRLRQLGPYSTLTTFLARVTPSGTKVLFQPSDETSRIDEYCVSPNGQYAAVESVPSIGVPDTYFRKLGYGSATTTIIDISSVRPVAAVDGGFSDWCVT